jgi:hypothetical protein
MTMNIRTSVFLICLSGCGQDEPSLHSEAAAEGVSTDEQPEQVPRAPFVPPDESDHSEIVDHIALLSDAQRAAVESFCVTLSRLSGDPEPYDTKVCASGDAQIILKMESEQAGSSQPLVEKLVRCAEEAQTSEALGSCRSR